MTKSKVKSASSAFKLQQQPFVPFTQTWYSTSASTSQQAHSNLPSIITNNNFSQQISSPLKHYCFKLFMSSSSLNMARAVFTLQDVHQHPIRLGSLNKHGKPPGYLKIMSYQCVFSFMIMIQNSQYHLTRSFKLQILTSFCHHSKHLIANAFAERWGRTVREECLDKIIILNEAHLCRVLKEYLRYYNSHRPQRGIQQDCPDTFEKPDLSHLFDVRMCLVASSKTTSGAPLSLIFRFR